MTTIPFPANRISPPPDRRAEVEALARELGGVVIWCADPQALTLHEAAALACLDWRVMKTPQEIAEVLFVTRDRAKQLLTILKRKGYAIRSGHYHRGGWLKCREQQPQTRAA